MDNAEWFFVIIALFLVFLLGMIPGAVIQAMNTDIQVAYDTGYDDCENNLKEEYNNSLFEFKDLKIDFDICTESRSYCHRVADNLEQQLIDCRQDILRLGMPLCQTEQLSVFGSDESWSNCTIIIQKEDYNENILGGL